MEQLANSPSSTLVGPINSSSTTLVVTSGATFPAAGNFIIKLGTELLKVTGVAGTTFTVARGQEGTTPASHASGDQAKQVVTAGVLGSLMAEFNKTGPWASRPTNDLVRAGTTYQATDVDLTWLYNGTDWDLIHPCYVPYANRVDVSGWTAFNLGSNVWTSTNGVVSVAQLGSSSANLRGYYHPVPTAPYTATLVLGPSPQTSLEEQDGIVLYDSVSGKFKYLSRGSVSTDYQMNVQNWNNSTSFNVNLIDNARRVGQTSHIFIRIEDNNTLWKYWVSNNNQDWHMIFSENRNTFLTPTHIGLGTYRDTNAGSGKTWYSRYYGYWEQ